jgi:hypothetical protein
MITEGPAVGGERRTIKTAERIPNAAIFLKRVAIEFLQVVFSTRLEGNLKYDPDDTKTEIQISDVHAVDLTAVNVRPAIIAVRGPLSWQGLGLGGSAGAGRDVKTGAHHFSDLLIGSVAFSCISREGIEAEQIGHLVFNSFKFFRPVLQKYGFLTIKSLNIGAEALIEQEGSDDRTTVVPVYITAQIQDRWVLEETVGRKLERIVIDHFVNIG